MLYPDPRVKAPVHCDWGLRGFWWLLRAGEDCRFGGLCRVRAGSSVRAVVGSSVSGRRCEGGDQRGRESRVVSGGDGLRCRSGKTWGDTVSRRVMGEQDRIDMSVRVETVCHEGRKGMDWRRLSKERLGQSARVALIRSGPSCVLTWIVGSSGLSWIVGPSGFRRDWIVGSVGNERGRAVARGREFDRAGSR